MDRVKFEARAIPEPNTGCWLWMGYVDAKGYGRIGANPTPQLAHRIAWRLYRGLIPDGLCVCHRCDNPSCVNPDHLFVGTVGENNADMRRKGRDSKPPRKRPYSPERKRPKIRRGYATGLRHGSKTCPERVARGERSAGARLTLEQVQEIRRRRGRGESLKDLAEAYGVGKSTISMIALGQTWAHALETRSLDDVDRALAALGVTR